MSVNDSWFPGRLQELLQALFRFVRISFCFTYSPTEAEVISLGAGLRMDGIPALDLWDF